MFSALASYCGGRRRCLPASAVVGSRHRLLYPCSSFGYFQVFLVLLAALALGACAGPAPTSPPTGAAVVAASATPVLGASPVSATPVLSPTRQVSPTPAPPKATSTPVATDATQTSSPTVFARASALSALKPNPRRVVLGYYVPYDVTSWLTLEARADQLDYVATQWVSIDACGGIGSRDDRTLVSFARSRGIRVLPSLLTSDQGLNHRLLTDDQARGHAVEQIVSYVVEEGYEGFDLDLEDMLSTDRAAYTAFIAELSAALHERGKILMAALPAKHYDATTGWAGPYDYAALAPYLDYAMIMTYDYSWASGPPGSIAPVQWVDQVMAFVSSQMPAQKVLLGLGFYGYDWNTTIGGRAKALRYDQAAALAGKYGAQIAIDPTTRSATFRYQSKLGDTLPASDPLPALNHEISVRKAPACARPLSTPTPAPPKSTVPPQPTATPAPVQQHAVWLENQASAEARLALVEKHALGGVGAWRLGQEDPAFWPMLDRWRQSNR